MQIERTQFDHFPIEETSSVAEVHFGPWTVREVSERSGLPTLFDLLPIFEAESHEEEEILLEEAVNEEATVCLRCESGPEEY